MRFVSALHHGRPLAALVEDDTLVPLCGITELGVDTPSSVLADPPLDRPATIPRHAVTLRPVVPTPGKVICVGLNYRTHIEETGRDDSSYPILFTKFASSLTGPYDPIPVPPESAKVDWEGEIAVVIGREARRVSKAEAPDHVAGYTVANDVSMRDFQRKTHQWLQGKAWDRSTALGPYLVTPDEVGDVAALAIRLELNGEEMQSSSTSLLIFDVPTIVSTLSEFCTIEPGDVILTGT